MMLCVVLTNFLFKNLTTHENIFVKLFTFLWRHVFQYLIQGFTPRSKTFLNHEKHLL